MPHQVSSPQAAATRRNFAIVLMAASVGLVLAATLALWAHYGTAVFFESIRAGFAACFG